MFGDYNARIKTFPEVKVCNEKAVRQAHEESLKEIDKYLKEASEFYQSQKGKEVRSLIG